MEGLTPTLVLSLYAGFALAGVSLALLAIAGGFFLTGRAAPRLFATALFSATAAAGFLGLAEAAEGHAWSTRHLYAGCLFLSACGPLLAAFRNPGRYLASCFCAVAASAFAVGALTVCYPHTWLRVLLVVLPCLVLAVASIVVSLASERPRERLILTLALINLVTFDLAFTLSATDDYALDLEPGGGMTFRSLIADLLENTHWRWVFLATTASILTSSALILYRSAVIRRRLGVVLLATCWPAGPQEAGPAATHLGRSPAGYTGECSSRTGKVLRECQSGAGWSVIRPEMAHRWLTTRTVTPAADCVSKSVVVGKRSRFSDDPGRVVKPPRASQPTRDGGLRIVDDADPPFYERGSLIGSNGRTQIL